MTKMKVSTKQEMSSSQDKAREDSPKASDKSHLAASSLGRRRRCEMVAGRHLEAASAPGPRRRYCCCCCLRQRQRATAEPGPGPRPIEAGGRHCDLELSAANKGAHLSATEVARTLALDQGEDGEGGAGRGKEFAGEAAGQELEVGSQKTSTATATKRPTRDGDTRSSPDHSAAAQTSTRPADSAPAPSRSRSAESGWPMELERAPLARVGSKRAPPAALFILIACAGALSTHLPSLVSSQLARWNCDKNVSASRFSPIILFASAEGK